MPRQTRLDLPGIAQHAIQRGNKRQPCFFRHVDRHRYLANLREAAFRYGCAVHAYVLMTRHVHLLVTPAGMCQCHETAVVSHSGAERANERAGPSPDFNPERAFPPGQFL